MKCFALTGLPFRRLAIENKQLSLSLITSALWVPVLLADLLETTLYSLSSLSIKGVSALSTWRLSGELTKL
jgi:hypothetical protein